MVEKKAARFIGNDYRYDTGNMTQIFKSLGWHTLKDCRREAKLALHYKITKALVAVNQDDYLINRGPRTHSINKMKFQHIQTSSMQYKNSFFPLTVRQWNELSQDTIDYGSPESFRPALHKD